MVETTLVTPERLPEVLQESGRHILAAMDVKGAEITAAFWLYLEEEDIWRLFLATPLTDTKGPLFIYKIVQEVLKEMSPSEEDEIGLMNIAVVSQNLLLVQNLQRRYGRIENEDTRRIRRVDSPYIYRLTIDGTDTEQSTNGKN